MTLGSYEIGNFIYQKNNGFFPLNHRLSMMYDVFLSSSSHTRDLYVLYLFVSSTIHVGIFFTTVYACDFCLHIAGLGKNRAEEDRELLVRHLIHFMSFPPFFLIAIALI